MDLWGLEVQDLPEGTIATDVTMLVQGLDPDGCASLFLRSTVTDQITRLGAITVLHTRLIAEVNEGFEPDEEE